MAGRPSKDSLDYFSKSTQFYTDTKIRRVLRKYGLNGTGIFDFLMCKIYSDKGYFVKYTEDLIFDIADILLLEEKLIEEVVQFLIECNLFDKSIFSSHKILTSVGIQKRWLDAMRVCKRVDKIISEEICLISIIEEINTNKIPNSEFNSNNFGENTEDISINSYEIPINSDKRKVKEIKENKNKIKKRKEDIPPAKAVRGKNDFISELFEIFKTEYKNIRGFELETDTPGKELSALGKMVSGYKKKYPDKNTNDAKEYFKEYFIKCLKIKDKWHYESMTPSHILNQKSKIHSILQNNNNGTKMADLSFMGIHNEQPKVNIDFSTV